MYYKLTIHNNNKIVSVIFKGRVKGYIAFTGDQR